MKNAVMLVLAGLLLVSAQVRVEDADKAAETKDAATQAPQGNAEEWEGVLCEKPTTAAPDVIAALTVPRENAADKENAKKARRKGPAPMLYLVATGDVAAKLTALKNDRARVKVAGRVTAGTMTVATITEIKQPEDGTAKGKSNK
jgi:hypothetical protein